MTWRRQKSAGISRSWTLKSWKVNFGGAGGKVDEDDPVEYSNSTGLMWGKVRKYLKDGRLQLPDDDALFAQLSNRKYRVNKDGKIELERKEDMKKRGLSSPDIAGRIGNGPLRSG